MAEPKNETGKKQCNIVLQVQFPIKTLKTLLDLFEKNDINLVSMVLFNEENSVSLLFLHLLIDQKTFDQKIDLIQSMPGLAILDENSINKKNIVAGLSVYFNQEPNVN